MENIVKPHRRHGILLLKNRVTKYLYFSFGTVRGVSEKKALMFLTLVCASCKLRKFDVPSFNFMTSCSSSRKKGINK